MVWCTYVHAKSTYTEVYYAFDATIDTNVEINTQNGTNKKLFCAIVQKLFMIFLNKNV